MLHINDHKKKFYCPIKKNRLAKAHETGDEYIPYTELQWSEEEFPQGKSVRLKGMPEHLGMKMFSVTVSPHRMDFVVINDTNQSCSDDTKNICAIRWFVEQFHREVKQLKGIDKCQCRKQRIQRNHIACELHVWVRLNILLIKQVRLFTKSKKTCSKII